MKSTWYPTLKSMKHINDSWKQKHEQTINVSVQIECESHNHKNIQFSSIFLETWKHEKSNFHWNNLYFKVYVCHIQTKVYTHILNTMSPQNVYAWRHVAQRIHMYSQ